MSLHKVEFKIVLREFPSRICTPSYIAMNKSFRQMPSRPCLEEIPVNREHTLWAPCINWTGAMLEMNGR